MSTQITLKRSISLPMMVLYGLGTTIGAGIYALVGEIAAAAGYMAPLSFLAASLIAGFTAMSFAELSSRFPHAAGAAIYVKHGLASRRLSTLVGLLVIAAGMVSAAALVNGFVGYLQTFVAIDQATGIVLVSLLLGSIAAWGIAESVTIASLVTLIEIGGLLLVISVSGGELVTTPVDWQLLVPSLDGAGWYGIYAGAILAFYAFIGFEDMVVVAEEVKNVRRNLPLAILLTLFITTLLYLTLMVSAVLTVPPDMFANSHAPLALIYTHHTGDKATLIGIIGMLAIINGTLIQTIMVSRVMYGMASHGQLPAPLAGVNRFTRTPLLATGIATGSILTLALAGDLAGLAQTSSVIMLGVFALVNLSLLRVKRRDPHPAGSLRIPYWIPLIGFLASLGFVLLELMNLIR